MNEERWFGLLGLIVGLYLFVCATWKRDFFLYDWKVQRAIAWYGEEKAHLGFQIGRQAASKLRPGTGWSGPAGF